MKKGRLAAYLIKGVVVVFAFVILNSESSSVEKDIAQCIGAKALLYTRSGCPHCEIQEKIFGDNYQYLNTIDCFYERESCANIGGIPTWVINGKQYVGVQSIERLKNYTGC